MTNEEIIDAIATKLEMFENDDEPDRGPHWATDEDAILDIVDHKSPIQIRCLLEDICELIEESDSLTNTFNPDSVIPSEFS